MKFGKLLKTTVDARMPQWRDYVLQYKKLKQAINLAVQQRSAGACSSEQVQNDFTNLLDVEVARVNDFYSDRIEEGVIILHALRGQAEKLASTGAPDKMRHACLQSLVTLHLNLLILQNYVALNFTAVAKILKKFDKKLGLTLRADYIAAIVELPFYRCQDLGLLVEQAESLFKAIETPTSAMAQQTHPHLQQQQWQQQQQQQQQQSQSQQQQQWQYTQQASAQAQKHAYGMAQSYHHQQHRQWQQQQAQAAQVAIS